MNTQLSPHESALSLCHDIAMTVSGEESTLPSSVVRKIAHLVIDECIMAASFVEDTEYYISVKEAINAM